VKEGEIERENRRNILMREKVGNRGVTKKFHRNRKQRKWGDITEEK
jgi:hypothetical protein